jgi:curved DNA-binding protein
MPMEYRDYYATLGVPRSATQAEIKKAFRKMARKHHPDVNKTDPDAERRFKEVNEAYAVLGEPDKRTAYDTLGANWEDYQRAGASRGPGRPGADPFAGFPGSAGAGGPGGIRFEFHGNPEDLEGFSDFFRTFFAGGSDPGTGSTGAARGRGRRTATRMAGTDAGLDELFGGSNLDDLLAADGRARANRPPPRQDIGAEVEVSLEEVATGTERLLDVEGRRLEVKIPKGVQTGQRIRLSGKAGTGPNAGHV